MRGWKINTLVGKSITESIYFQTEKGAKLTPYEWVSLFWKLISSSYQAQALRPNPQSSTNNTLMSVKASIYQQVRLTRIAKDCELRASPSCLLVLETSESFFFFTLPTYSVSLCLYSSLISSFTTVLGTHIQFNCAVWPFTWSAAWHDPAKVTRERTRLLDPAEERATQIEMPDRSGHVEAGPGRWTLGDRFGQGNNLCAKFPIYAGSQM